MLIQSISPTSTTFLFCLSLLWFGFEARVFVKPYSHLLLHLVRLWEVTILLIYIYLSKFMRHQWYRNLSRPSALRQWVSLIDSLDHVYDMAFHFCPHRKTLTFALTALYLNFCNIPFIWVRKLQKTYLLTDSLSLSLFFLHLLTHSLLTLILGTKDSHSWGLPLYIISY